jgi:hypothetical protein
LDDIRAHSFGELVCGELVWRRRILVRDAVYNKGVRFSESRSMVGNANFPKYAPVIQKMKQGMEIPHSILDAMRSRVLTLTATSCAGN